jgi:hypothetical protein
MIVALLGNPAPQMQVPELDADGIPTGATRSVPAPHVQQSVTRVEFADYIDDQDFVDLTLSNLTAVSAASTTLPGEITTAGGGLIRKQVTYAHTATTNTSTLTGTFTANGTDSLPVTVAKIGVLNALTVGTLAYETLLNATATLTISGDNVTVTETVTGG